MILLARLSFLFLENPVPDLCLSDPRPDQKLQKKNYTTSSFSILEVAEVSSNVPDIELQVPLNMRQALVREIAETRRFRSVIQQTDETEGVLLLESVILSYEKGSRTKRYVISLGSGKSYMTMVDKATEKKLFEADFEGEISGGRGGPGKLDHLLRWLRPESERMRSHGKTKEFLSSV